MSSIKKIMLVLTLFYGIYLIVHFGTPSEPLQSALPNKSITYLVQEVSDGDTLRVTQINNQQSQRVRIIGIDAPERARENQVEECYAEESYEFLKSLLSEGSEITLQYDDSQGRTDRFDRLLAHIYQGNNNVGEQLIRQGYAYEYTYNEPYAYQTLFIEAENDAREAQRGIWNPQLCPPNTL